MNHIGRERIYLALFDYPFPLFVDVQYQRLQLRFFTLLSTMLIYFVVTYIHL